ncbi:MAG: hypothetical protein D6690_15615 [Nitrospirae bacterium]|nr:MAG: hypothetical protein D6690_15615 [Nitrospirota bacterium]
MSCISAEREWPCIGEYAIHDGACRRFADLSQKGLVMRSCFLPLTIIMGVVCAGLDLGTIPPVNAQPQARTESICNLGMIKGETHKSCRVPIPSGCTVAQFPGYSEPWADVSSAGRTQCRFDERQTDWKTTIVGTCSECLTDHCSGRFSVMLNCSHTIPPADLRTPHR